MIDRVLEMWAVMRRNSLRTLLTASGVFWGMFMLVLMLGFGDGLESGVKRNMLGFSTNAVYVWSRTTRIPYKGLPAGRPIRFENGDIELLAEQVEGLEYLAPRVQLGGHRGTVLVTGNGEEGSFQVAGDYPEYQYIQAMTMTRGRWINHRDMVDGRKVAVVGRGVTQQLFPGLDPLGETIQVAGVAFQIVGEFRANQAGDGADRIEMALHIPFTTFQSAFNQPAPHWFALTGMPEVSGVELENRVRSVLGQKYRIHPDDRSALGSFNSEEEFQKIQSLFDGIRFLVWFVGTATLLSGLVGVSNILLITVRERTSEIGVRRALGATRFSVITMIVQEALFLTAVSGYAGLVIGVAVLELGGLLIGPDNTSMGQPHISLDVALLAACVLVVGGLFAGAIPAHRAASIQPVEALRS